MPHLSAHPVPDDPTSQFDFVFVNEPPGTQPSNAPGSGTSATGRNHGPEVAEAAPTAYSCPFRARKPSVFNPNDYESCAHSFSSISLVKRHVLRSHNAEDFTDRCPRCKVWFRKKAFKTHQRNQGCNSWQPPAVDKYDKGITKAMASSLRKRRVRYQVKTWEDLVRTIFPETQDNIVPDFERIVDLREAWEQVNQPSAGNMHANTARLSSQPAQGMTSLMMPAPGPMHGYGGDEWEAQASPSNSGVALVAAGALGLDQDGGWGDNSVWAFGLPG